MPSLLLLAPAHGKAERQGIPRPILLTLAAVRHVWGLDISGLQQPGQAPPAPVPTRVVLQLCREAGDGSAGGGSSEGGGEAGAPLPGGPFPAELRFSCQVHCTVVGRKAYLTGKLHGLELQRAVVGLERVGLQRLDAGTVALVVARPPGYRPPRPPLVRARLG
jgi:hypothetical protein